MDRPTARWISAASSSEWAAILDPAAYPSTAVYLALPRQEIDTQADLRDALATAPALAPLMKRPAEYARIAAGPLAIDKVMHKALVRMDEEGTVAAAATAITVFQMSARPMPINFTVDRPHVFLIRHVTTGAVVFAGYVADPKPLAATLS